jgi:hypothetical protein
MAELSAATGSVLGKAQKAEQQQQQEAERALIEEERAYQGMQRQAAQQWEIEKMRMRSEQDLAHEMRMRQSQLEKEARAEEWAVEKMELASRIDFEREEKSRQMQLSRLDSQIQTLQDKIDSGELSGSDLAIRNKLTWLEAQREAVDAGITGPSYSMTAISPPREAVGTTPYYEPGTEFSQRYPERAAQLREKSLQGIQREPTAAEREREEFTRFKRIDELTGIVSSFEENVTINPGIFTLGTKKVPLAVRDSKGNLVEATTAEQALYKETKARLARMVASKPVDQYPDFISTDPTERQKYDTLLKRGWTSEAIKDAMGK